MFALATIRSSGTKTHQNRDTFNHLEPQQIKILTRSAKACSGQGGDVAASRHSQYHVREASGWSAGAAICGVSPIGKIIIISQLQSVFWRTLEQPRMYGV